MALGDGIRRNIASVDPSERALLRDALIALNQQHFPGSRTDPVPGGVSWWFKQDEIHQATHVHGGPEFIPWHREIVNRLEEMLRSINSQLSLHYWDWTQHPRAIPNANLGGGTTGTLNLFTPDFMGYGDSTIASIGEPWLSAGFYVPGANPHRDGAGGNAADPPRNVRRSVSGSPASAAEDLAILSAADYPLMRNRLEPVHNDMHGFVNMGNQHISFRDPFVFLLHSNVDRLFARWQTDPAHPERLDPALVYGSESNLDVQVGSHIQNVNHNVEPWSTGQSEDLFGVEHFTRPWYAPENLGVPKTYKHASIVTPPTYDTNGHPIPIDPLESMKSLLARSGRGGRFGLAMTDMASLISSRAALAEIAGTDPVQDRLAALERMEQVRAAASSAGARVEVDYESEQAYVWSVRRMGAERDASGQQAHPRASLEAHLARMQELERRLQVLVGAGEAGLLDLLATNVYRLQAEYWLAQGKVT